MDATCADWPQLDIVGADVDALWRAQRGWRGDSLRPGDWQIELPLTFSSRIQSLARAARRATDLAVDLAALPYSIELRSEVEARLEGGCGFCVLRRLPPAGDDRLNAQTVLALSLLFGRPVAQTLQGDIVARVENRCGDRLDPSVRGHSTSAELAFHSDRADRIVLYCIRPSAVGGESRVVSALYLREQMRARLPHLLATLEQPIAQDRRGEQASHEAPYCEIPVFCEVGGAFVCRYVRRFIHDARRHPGAPPIAPGVIEALDHLDALMAETGVALPHRLDAGDLQILNNAVVLHARASFTDDAAAPRLLLRTWLSPRASRPLPDAFAPLYGSTEAGAYRGGVWPADRRALALSIRA